MWLYDCGIIVVTLRMGRKMDGWIMAGWMGGWNDKKYKSGFWNVKCRMQTKTNSTDWYQVDFKLAD